MPTIVTDHEARPGQLPHTLEVDRGIAIRLYLWTYAANPRRINTCKMFWAFVLMPLVMPFSLLIHGAGKVLDWWDEHGPAPKSVGRAYTPPPVKTGPSKGERLLEAFSNFMAKVWFRLQPLLKWGGIAIGALIALALLYLIITNIEAVGLAFLKVLLWGIASIAIAAVMVGIVYGLDRLGLFGSLGRKIGGFFSLMKQLYRSVHDHTCANVKVKD